MKRCTGSGDELFYQKMLFFVLCSCEKIGIIMSDNRIIMKQSGEKPLCFMEALFSSENNEKEEYERLCKSSLYQQRAEIGRAHV